MFYQVTWRIFHGCQLFPCLPYCYPIESMTWDPNSMFFRPSLHPKGRAGGSVGARPCKAGQGPTAGRYRTHHLWRSSPTFLGKSQGWTPFPQNGRVRSHFIDMVFTKPSVQLIDHVDAIRSSTHLQFECSFNCGLSNQNWTSKADLGAIPLPPNLRAWTVQGGARTRSLGYCVPECHCRKKLERNNLQGFCLGRRNEGEMDDVDFLEWLWVIELNNLQSVFISFQLSDIPKSLSKFEQLLTSTSTVELRPLDLMLAKGLIKQ